MTEKTGLQRSLYGGTSNRNGKALFLVFSLLLTCITFTCAVPPDDICGGLKATYRESRFLTRSEVSLYCDNNCNFLKRINCDTAARSGKQFDLLKSWFRNMTDFLLEDERIPEKAEWTTEVDGEYVYDVILWLLWPLSVLIVIVSSSGLSHSFNTIVCLSYMAVCLYQLWGDWVILTHNLVYGFIFMSAPQFNRSGGKELAMNYILLFILGLVSVATSTVWIHFMAGAIVIVLVSIVMYQGIVDRYHDYRIYLVLAVCQIAITLDFMVYLVEKLAVENVGIALVYVSFSGMMPYGSYRSIVSNMQLSVRFLVQVAPGKAAIWYVLGGLITFISSNLFIRTILGAAVLDSFKYERGSSLLLSGLMVYVVGLWAPLLYFFELLEGRRFRANKFFFSLVLFILTACEMCYGIEIFVVRFVLSTGAQLFDIGHQVNAAFSLYGDVDVGKGLAFPKEGAWPFVSLMTLCNAGKSTVECTAYMVNDLGQKLNGVTGNGFVIGHEGRKSLVSVSHVLSGRNRCAVSHGGVSDELVIHTVECLGGGDDPPVLVRYDGPIEACEIPVLTKSEHKNVTYLFCVHNRQKVTPITDFSIGHGGQLNAVVNVMQGDSGSPVFAVLKHGQLRLAAVVSKGRLSHGGSNILAYFDPGGTFGSENVNISTNISNQNQAAFGAIRDYLEKNQVAKVAFESEREAASDDEFEDASDDEGEKRKRKRKEPKNWKKNRAYDKRRAGLTALVQTAGMSEELQEEVMAAFSRGEVVDFNKRRMRRDAYAGIGFVHGET